MEKEGAGSIDLEALRHLCREFDVDLLILYGSRATGQTHAQSDVDVGFVRKAGPLAFDRWTDLQGRLAELVSSGDVDLVDLARVPGLLRHLACERGRLLYESAPGVFSAFRVLAWNLYQDERIQIRPHDSEGIRVTLRYLSS